jgi:hypothetical protein
MPQSKHKGVGEILRKKRLHSGGAFADTTSIMVGKELVLIEDQSVSQNSLYDRVLFTKNYVPYTGITINGKTVIDIDTCKKIFRQTFGGEKPMSLDFPYLPCSNKDNGVASAVITRGLRNRFGTLSQEIILLESTQKDTAVLRTKLGQLGELRELINAVNVSPRCHDYVNNTSSDKVAEILQDAEWDAMVRAFAVVYLIAKGKGTTRLEGVNLIDRETAISIVEDLSAKPISLENLEKFSDEFRKSGGNPNNIVELVKVLNKDTPGAGPAIPCVPGPGDPGATGAPAAAPACAGIVEGNPLYDKIDTVKRTTSELIQVIRNRKVFERNIAKIKLEQGKGTSSDEQRTALQSLLDAVEEQQRLEQAKENSIFSNIASQQNIKEEIKRYEGHIDTALRDAQVLLETRNYSKNFAQESLTTAEATEKTAKEESAAADQAYAQAQEKNDNDRTPDNAQAAFDAQNEKVRLEGILRVATNEKSKAEKEVDAATEQLGAAEAMVAAITNIKKIIDTLQPTIASFYVNNESALTQERDATDAKLGETPIEAEATRKINSALSYTEEIGKYGGLGLTKESVAVSITKYWLEDKEKELKEIELILKDGKDGPQRRLNIAEKVLSNAQIELSTMSRISKILFGTKSISKRISTAEEQINNLKKALSVYEQGGKTANEVLDATEKVKHAKLAYKYALEKCNEAEAAAAAAAAAAAEAEEAAAAEDKARKEAAAKKLLEDNIRAAEEEARRIGTGAPLVVLEPVTGIPSPGPAPSTVTVPPSPRPAPSDLTVPEPPKAAADPAAGPGPGPAPFVPLDPAAATTPPRHVPFFDLSALGPGPGPGPDSVTEKKKKLEEIETRIRGIKVIYDTINKYEEDLKRTITDLTGKNVIIAGSGDMIKRINEYIRRITIIYNEVRRIGGTIDATTDTTVIDNTITTITRNLEEARKIDGEARIEYNNIIDEIRVIEQQKTEADTKKAEEEAEAAKRVITTSITVDAAKAARIKLIKNLIRILILRIDTIRRYIVRLETSITRIRKIKTPSEAETNAVAAVVAASTVISNINVVVTDTEKTDTQESVEQLDNTIVITGGAEKAAEKAAIEAEAAADAAEEEKKEEEAAAAAPPAATPDTQPVVTLPLSRPPSATSPPGTPPAATPEITKAFNQKQKDNLLAALKRIPNLTIPYGGNPPTPTIVQAMRTELKDSKLNLSQVGTFDNAYNAAANAASTAVLSVGGKPVDAAIQAFNKVIDPLLDANQWIRTDKNRKPAYKKAATALIRAIIVENIKQVNAQRGGADIPDITTRDPTTTQSYKELAEDVTGKLRTSLDTCTEDLSRCEQEKEKNRAAIESLTANIASLQADLRTQMANAAKSSQDLTAKLGDLDSAKASDAESTKALADATEQYKALIAESQAKLAETDTQLKETRAKIEGLTAEIETADKKTQENEGLIADLKATIARLQPKAQAQAGGTLQTHPLLELAAAISAATSLFPK